MTKGTKRKRAHSKPAVRCAIYTRKSSNEGLEQDFNSLDAQREACEAFVLSQKHEGWIALPEMYDDGGISGGTIDRPALKRLLADIEAHRVDAVVIYKVDRLTRALSDFAKIVEVFDRHGEVQAVLARNRVDREAGIDAKQPGLLSGLLHDAQDQPMTPTHAIKKGKRYRYYVSRPLITERAGAACGQRLPAASLEPLVVERIRVLLADPGAVLDALQGHLESAPMQRQLVDRAGQMAKSLPALSKQDLRVFILRIASRIQVHNDRVEITLDPVELLMLLGESQGNPATADLQWMAPIVLTVEARLKRTGIEKRMVLGNGLEAATADPSLLRLIARAHGIRKRLFDYTTLSLKEIAKEEDVVGSYVTRLLRLSFLAPDIVAAILKGEQPAELTASRLAQWKNLPLDWAEQRKVLGFT